jgi:hypothetical protein
MATTSATLKKLFWSTDSDVSLTEAREKNAQIGDEIIVDGVPVYQDGNGAPVEQVSPLGYHVGWAGILFLNVSQMVGTGVFSTREYLSRSRRGMQDGSTTKSCTAGSILRALNSVGLSLIYWVIGAIIAAGMLAILGL